MRETALTIQVIRLLEWLGDDSHDDSLYYDLGEFGSLGRVDVGMVDALSDSVERSGYCAVERPFDGSTSARLTEAGRTRLQEIRSARENRVARQNDLKSSMLRWLYEQEEDGRSPSDWRGFEDAGYSFWGDSNYSLADATRQAPDLFDRGLIRSTTAMGIGNGCIRPELTVAGRDCVTDYDADVSAFTKNSRRQVSTSTFNAPVFYGEIQNSQLAWANRRVSQGNTNTANAATGYESLVEVVLDLLGRLPQIELDDDDRADAQEQAEIVLSEVAEPEPDRGTMRRALTFLRGVLAPVATQAVAGAGHATADATNRWATEILNTLQLPPV